MKVVLGIAGGFAALIGLIFWLTGDVTKAGDDFFAAVQNDDIDAAYELLSDDFKAGTSKEELKAYLSTNALDKVSEVSWGGRSIQNNRGELDGTVQTESGGSIPLTLKLVNGESGWKIQSIRKEPAGFESGSADNPLPPKEKQTQLFKDTIAVFADSLAKKDMTPLHEYSSGAFQSQASVDRLDGAFSSFYKYADGYQKLKTKILIIDSAKIDDESGILKLRGHYPVKPIPVHFYQSYIYEGTGWKLFGISLKLGSPPET